MKPHDQTWRVGRKVPRHIYRADDDSVVGTLDREDDARLASLAPEMARMLLDLEWCGSHCSQPCCEQCGELEHHEHQDECAWLAIMKKTGLR